MLMHKNKLIDHVKKIFIVKHKEDTSLLEKALHIEGFKTFIVKTDYTNIEMEYSNQSRCLLNHSKAWNLCTKQKGISMIVEADFVPVVGMGQLPMPFDPEEKDISFAWLYSASGSLWTVTEDNYAIGFSSTNVAILLSAKVAEVMVEFAENEFVKHDPRDYFPWDTYHWSYLVKHKINPYIPYRCYGEHGGLPNMEHKHAGLNSSHHADTLWNKIHFLPMYAKGSNTLFQLIRIKSKIRGIARFFLGKYLKFTDINMRKKVHKENFPIIKMFLFSLKRLITIY